VRACVGEWIIERPALCNNTFTKCFLTALADFHTTVMGQAKAQGRRRQAPWPRRIQQRPIFMVDPLKTGGFIHSTRSVR